MLETMIMDASKSKEDIIEHTDGNRHVFTNLVCKRKIFLSTLIPSAICVHFSQLVDHYVTCAYTS